MAEKPVLRVGVGARALRELIKNCGWTGRASAGVQGTRVWAWISGAPVRAGWVCDGEVRLSFCGVPRGVCKAPLMAVVRLKCSIAIKVLYCRFGFNRTSRRMGHSRGQPHPKAQALVLVPYGAILA